MTEYYYYEHEDTPIANRCEPIVAEAIKRIDEIENELAELRHYTIVMKGKLNGLRTWLTQEHTKTKEIEKKKCWHHGGKMIQFIFGKTQMEGRRTREFLVRLKKRTKIGYG